MITLKETAYASKQAYLDNRRKSYRFVHRSKYKVVSFRGIASLDHSIEPEEFHFCDRRVRVHGDVLSAFQEIEPELTQDIMAQKEKHLVFCGYSVGGAIAVLAAVYYAEMFAGQKKIECHTFGSPCVGDAAFVEWCKDRIAMAHVMSSEDPKYENDDGYVDFDRVWSEW